MFNFSLNFACEKHAAVGIFYAQFTSDWTVWQRKSGEQRLESLWSIQRKAVIPLIQHVEGRLKRLSTLLCNTPTADDKCIEKRYKTSKSSCTSFFFPKVIAMKITKDQGSSMKYFFVSS